MPQDLSYLGFGIGLRPSHYEDIIALKPAIDWFEILTEDFIVQGGSPLYYLDRIREHYPLAMHGVSLSIGGTDPLDQTYLSELKKLIGRVDPCWVSDHFCWTGVGGVNTHGLLPLPFTEEVVKHVVARTKQVQDFLGRQILLENISSYVDYTVSEMTEWEFMMAVAEQADCLLLFDVNNAFVNAFNHGFSAMDFVEGLSPERVQQFHMAGHDHQGTHIIDTHDHDIVNEVWSLYEAALKRFGAVSTLIERDDNIPDLNGMMHELAHAKSLYQQLDIVESVR